MQTVNIAKEFPVQVGEKALKVSLESRYAGCAGESVVSAYVLDKDSQPLFSYEGYLDSQEELTEEILFSRLMDKVSDLEIKTACEKAYDQNISTRLPDRSHRWFDKFFTKERIFDKFSEYTLERVRVVLLRGENE